MLVMTVVFVSVMGTVFVVEPVVIMVDVTAQSVQSIHFPRNAVILTWARCGGDQNGARGVAGGLGIGYRRSCLGLGFNNGSLLHFQLVLFPIFQDIYTRLSILESREVEGRRRPIG